MAKRKNNKLFWGLAVLAIVLIALAVYKAKNRPKGEKVSVEEASRRTLKEQVAASGKIFPETEVKISSDVSGEIVELFVEEGDSIVEGQILARIDPDAYQSQVERGSASVNNAKAQLANARSGIERSKAQLAQAVAQKEQINAQFINTRDIHNRNKTLHEQGIISDAEFEASLSNLNAIQANLRSAEAAIKTAEANQEAARQTAKAADFTVKSTQASLKELQTSLRRTTIYAPHSGIISVLNVEQGERVVGTIQMTGTEMMRIANMNVMEVQVDVSENDVLRVSVGDHCEIEVDAYLDRKFSGKVTEIANSASGTGNSISLTTDQVINFIVKIRIDPASYADLISPIKPFPFRPGMSASVEINTQTENNALSVPIQAVTTKDLSKKKPRDPDAPQAREVSNKADELKEVVFLASGDTTSIRVVKTGVQDDTYIQIVDGLQEGEQVIIAPYSAISKKLEDGSKITVVEEDELYKN